MHLVQQDFTYDLHKASIFKSDCNKSDINMTEYLLKSEGEALGARFNLCRDLTFNSVQNIADMIMQDKAPAWKKIPGNKTAVYYNVTLDYGDVKGLKN